jgi:hypothetical protein
MAGLVSCSGGSSRAPTGPIEGFVQTIKTTKCRLGGNVKHESEAGGAVETWSGTEGLFEFFPATEDANCLADWPSAAGPDRPAEITDVKAYFVGAGMPLAQIGPISSTYSFAANGGTFSDVVITRVVDGVQVPDSHGAAGMVQGQSVSETVYWPALPASVREELAQLNVIAADPQKLAAFQAKLPSGFLSGSIVIHHTNENQRVPGHPAERVQIEAHACYDALIAHGQEGVTECFLPDGT